MYEVKKNIFPLEWRLSDDLKVPYHGKKVFGTFICGGGSTMGYKLAGYDHIGGVEFTNHYAKVYKTNHDPKNFYLEDVREFVNREDLPESLFDIDLLDGSPPCAAFSTVGGREKMWGKKSKYEDKMQVKDDLVFVYCDLIEKIKPRVALLENVSGLIKGNAKYYTKRIIQKLKKIGYKPQLFLLNAASMGIPQLRPRTFFIALRNDYDLPKLSLNFNCPTVGFGITKKYWNHQDNKYLDISNCAIGDMWDEIDPGERHKKRFSLGKAVPNRPCYTITESDSGLCTAGVCHPYQKRKLNKEEVRLISTFPIDFNFCGINPVSVMGRSVLPVMMANVSHQIYLQWLSKIK